MKANEAPEKLYLRHDLSHPAGKRYLNLNKLSDNDIEYTRTDAFIEKAKNFFENYFEEEECKFGVSEWVEVRSDFESLDSLIRAFLNYI